MRVAVRDAAAAVISSVSAPEVPPLILANDLTAARIRGWQTRWGGEIERSFADHGARFVVFIDRIDRNIVIVDRQTSGEDYVRPNGDGARLPPWHLSPDLMNVLIWRSEKSGRGHLLLMA